MNTPFTIIMTILLLLLAHRGGSQVGCLVAAQMGNPRLYFQPCLCSPRKRIDALHGRWEQTILEEPATKQIVDKYR